MSTPSNPLLPCPCGSGAAYQDCCAPLHGGIAAPTAEALMRSRYSAYVLEIEPYLLETWHPRTRPTHISFANPHGRTQWLGLRVLAHRQVDEAHAEVEFEARYKIGSGGAQRQHELSRFVREGGRWFYVDGTYLDLA